MSGLSRRLVGECLGTAFLVATVVGSGVMAERLAGGNAAIALLGNTLATSSILIVLITMLAPVSGAHFNPAVTLVFAIRKEIVAHEAGGYMLAQLLGAFLGVWAAHAMFAETVLQVSQKVRSGEGQWLSEGVATFGLVLTILGVRKAQAAFVPVAVGLYIAAAYWFTASTSFANPAVTMARVFSDTFAGIRPMDAPMFVVAQLVGALLATAFGGWFLEIPTTTSERTGS